MAVPSEPPRDTLVTFLPPRGAPWPAGVLLETDASTDHSRTPRTAWPYDATRDAGLAQVDPDLLTRVGR